MGVKRNRFGLRPLALVQGMFSVALLWLTRDVQFHEDRAFMRCYTFVSKPLLHWRLQSLNRWFLFALYESTACCKNIFNNRAFRHSVLCRHQIEENFKFLPLL